MNKQILVSVGVVLAIVLGLYGAFRTAVTTVVNNPPFGATPTLDGVDNPYVSINGLREYHFSKPLTATSTFLCQVLNPFAPATTSIDKLQVNITGGILGANVLYIATSSSSGDAYSTTTPPMVAAFPIASLAQANLNWFPPTGTTTNPNYLQNTGASGMSMYIATGSSYINFKLATTTGGTFATYMTGTCSGLLRKL